MQNLHFTSLRQTALRLLCGLALLAPLAARAADIFRLDRIAVLRFSETADGRLRRQYAVLHASGQLELHAAFDFDRPVDTPPWILNRNLIPQRNWIAFHNLGGESTRNFRLEEGAVTVSFDNDAYHFVGVDPEAAPAGGRVVNLSTRVRIGGGSGPIVAGFVVEQNSRKLLVRAVGPTLRRFGVADVVANPKLALFNASGERVQWNDDWHDSAVADEVRDATARVGAFALEEGAADAAIVTELSPGAYSAVVEVPPGTEGTVLVEIYSVPAS